MSRHRAKLILSRAADRTIAGDPGLVRLRAAGRALGTALLSVLLGAALMLLRDLSTSVLLVGATLGVVTTFVVNDPEPRDEQRTLALFAPVASLGLVLGTLVAPKPWLAAPLMLIGTFVAVWARGFGPRGNALGSAGVFGYFFALFYRLPLWMLGWMSFAIFTGIGSAALMRFVVFREKPERVARNTLRAFEARAFILLDLTARWLRAPNDAPRLRKKVRKALEAFEEIALELEERLERSARPALDVLDVELAVERIAESGSRRKIERADREEQLAMADRIAELTSAARGVAPYEGGDHRVLRVLAHIDRMRERIDERPSLIVSESIVPPPPAPSMERFRRQALQATIGGLFAFAVGYAIAPQRWPWAVLASFVVFNRTTTAGDTLMKAWQRVVGTALGVIAGASIASVLTGHRNVEIALMFVCVFLAYYFMRVSYAWSAAWSTALGALAWHALGRFSTGLLLVRVEETIVGAAFGAMAAAWVRPERASDRVRDRSAEILRGVAHRLRNLDVPLEPRVFDRQMQKLRENVRPARRSPFVRARSTAEIARHVSALVYSVRHLSGLPCNEQARAVLVGEARAAERLADALVGAREPTAPKRADEIERARKTVCDADERRAIHWIGRIDAALGALANEL